MSTSPVDTAASESNLSPERDRFARAMAAVVEVYSRITAEQAIALRLIFPELDAALFEAQDAIDEMIDEDEEGDS